MDNNFIWIIIGGMLLPAIYSASSQLTQLTNEAKKTNSLLQKIAKQVGVPEPPVDEEIRALLAKGKKIPAIKRYREISGAGLKEAKEYIDSL